VQIFKTLHAATTAKYLQKVVYVLLIQSKPIF